MRRCTPTVLGEQVSRARQCGPLVLPGEYLCDAYPIFSDPSSLVEQRDCRMFGSGQQLRGGGSGSVALVALGQLPTSG